MLELSAGPLRLALRPDLGGSIAGLWHDGLPVLRSTEPAALSGPRAAGCFPLVPYSNRLGYCRFSWQGQSYTTEPNFDDSPHSLHGVGWAQPWRVEDFEDDAATLSYRHQPDAHWPFAFEAQQRFELRADGLRLALAVTNRDARSQPMGVGWHPYFPRRAGSHVRLHTRQRWNFDAVKIPTHAVPQSGIDANVAALAYDHCFDGWDGVAEIEDDVFQLRLSATLQHAVVFTPPDRDFFCVEPVSHLNDAIHRADPLAHGLVDLPPGATLQASMALAIAPRQPTL